MKNNYLHFLAFLALFISARPAIAQVKFGGIYGFDLYHWYRNPNVTPDSIGVSVGSALSTFSIGPKLWIGGQKFSVSIEGQAAFSIGDLNIGRYAGFGSLAFPMMARLNFGGLSGFIPNSEKKSGFSIGGGIQYTRAPLLAVPRRYEGAISFYPMYIGELGFGSSDRENLDQFMYLRFCAGPDKAFGFAIGGASGFVKARKQKKKKEDGYY